MHLTEPLTLPCGLVLPNRLAKAAMTEQLSAAGVPVVIADIKGDVSGLAAPGEAGGPAEGAPVIGLIDAPALARAPLQWHAHEMFFGFGWAVLGGFLLTSTKNWVGVRGYHGATLMFLAAAWVFERIGMSFGGGWPRPLFLLSNNLFLCSIVVLLLATLIRNRDKDSYRRDNVFFLIVLPLFWVAKTLLLSPEHFNLGWSMTLGIFRVAFLVMLERTLGQFMRGAFQVDILRQPALDLAIKALAIVLVFTALLPSMLAHGIELLLATLLLARFVFWHPLKGFRRLDIGIMYLGYLAIVAQLLIDALRRNITGE